MDKMEELFQKYKQRIEFFDNWEGFSDLPDEIRMLIVAGYRETKDTMKKLEEEYPDFKK
ncbi:hypothetical protein JFL43_09065 [Viridibacillus sp. YIM B01967]|uniref:Uncharacterized protein n=1 Tax=Viridibacillus soli TaxID=2798301 RepID=A0ABS1H6F8_9BACL|nr:hypothetical protein [Viridibacillus soli]MBK3495007.1 hypothetical protein [Viridibacillus soli]